MEVLQDIIFQFPKAPPTGVASCQCHSIEDLIFGISLSTHLFSTPCGN